MPRKKCAPCKALKANLANCKKRNCKSGQYCYAHKKTTTATQLARRNQLAAAYRRR